jgi:hypothetical protein
MPKTIWFGLIGSLMAVFAGIYLTSTPYQDKKQKELEYFQMKESLSRLRYEYGLIASLAARTKCLQICDLGVLDKSKICEACQNYVTQTTNKGVIRLTKEDFEKAAVSKRLTLTEKRK